MSRFWALLFAAPLFAATVPNRYIVELSTQPVAARVAGEATRGSARTRLHSAAAERQRTAVRAQQAVARAAVERSGGHVSGTIENLINALLIEIPDEKAAELRRVPGVKTVHAVRVFEMSLDHALSLHHVPDAWTQVGLANAGAGMRIGMIDSGIEIGHAGFNDAGFTAPAGFPVAGSVGDLAFTNNKVIVARSYASLFITQDPDPSVRDHIGHGTGTAMAAAGVSNSSVLTTISGVAPQAYLGVYKVFGTPGFNDGGSESAILTAIEDAVNDGMNVLNLSFGVDVAGELGSDPTVQVVEAASALGMIVVASAGNNGPNPGTVGTPASAPHAIAAAASNNDRMFTGTVQVAGNSINALPGTGVNSFTPISGPFFDISTLDATGLACNPLPPAALSGAVALISRGDCTFESKLDNAQAAGAVAAVIIDNVANEPLVLMGVGEATLPAEMVSNADGLGLRQQIALGQTVTLQFYAPTYVNPSSLAGFSAAGPNVDYSIKPDLTAVGENFYTAAQTVDPAGELYNPTGYIITQGTSFAAPLISGAAALLEAARPGLTADQYRSLLIDTADAAYAVPGVSARVQQAGSGLLNVLSALNATAAVAPVSLSFGVSRGVSTGVSAGQINSTQTLTISNVGAVADTFQIAAIPREPGAPVPQFATTMAQLAPGASISIPVVFAANGLAPGQYEGFIQIQGAASSVPTQAPYWLAVPSGTPAFITVLSSSSSASAGSTLTQAAIFRITDAAGLPVSTAPTVTTISGGGRVNGVATFSSAYPNDYALSVRLGTQPGSNVFQIQTGSLSSTVTISGQ